MECASTIREICLGTSARHFLKEEDMMSFSPLLIKNAGKDIGSNQKKNARICGMRIYIKSSQRDSAERCDEIGVSYNIKVIIR